MAQQTFEEIVAAVKLAESRGKRYAADGKTLTTSPKGALGEMQVMPKTITDPGFGVIPAKDASPDEIARVGRDYLQAMKQRYGDTEKALIAYNMGPGATDKWLATGAKPEKLPEETRTYVQRVKGFLGKDVSRETMAKKEREPLPPSLPPMAEAAPASAPAKTAMAKMDIKSLPASYQAAFALAALADAKDDEDDKAYDENKETESEKLMREYKPVNHLASLDLSVTPITMAEGGEIDADKRPDDINYFSNVNRMKDRGVTTDSVMLGARAKAGEGSFVAGLNMSNMSRDEKMQTARALMLAYTQQDPEGLGFNANVVKPQGAPAMANLMGFMPLGEGRVSAGMHGNQAYSLGYERPVEGGQFNANLNVPRGTMGSPQLNLQYNKRFADGGEVEQERLTPQQIERIAAQGPTERKDEPFFDAASRTYVDVLTGRRTPITEKDFTAKEQMAMMDAVKKSQARGGKGRVGYEDYPDAGTVGPGYVDIRNTLGGFQYKQNPDGSTVITDKYDFHGPRVAEYEKMGSGEKLVKSAKNALVEFVTSGGGVRDLAGELGRAYVGSKGPEVNIRIPVKRAKGSPEEGEVTPRLTMQQIERIAAQESAEREAASNAAFIAQKSGIGRKAGPVSQALQSGQGQIEFLKGMTNIPQNFVGAPMDISNMIANVYGGGVEKPFMGSEYLKEKSRAAGLGFTPSKDPTLAGFYGAGDLGSNLVNPAGATRAGVKAAGAVAEKAGNAARDFQQYNQQLAVPGASYIRRPAGGVFPTAKNVDEEPISFLDSSLKNYTENIRFADGSDENKAAAKEFIDTKLRDYYKTKAGSVSDPIREALISGRIKIPKDTPLEEQFPQALINASRAGDVTAMREIEKRFDNMMNITNYRVKPVGATATDDIEAAESFKQTILQQMKANPSIIPDEFLLRLSKKDADALPPQKAEETIKEIRQKLADNPTLFNTIYEPKISRLLDNQLLENATPDNLTQFPQLYPVLANASKRKEGIMALEADVPITDLNYMGVSEVFGVHRDDLIQELVKINPKDLAQMSVPEFYAKAMPSIAKAEVFREKIRTVDKLAAAGKPVPVEIGQFGTKEFLPTDSSGMTWREITDPQAALIQAKFLSNSIGGYAKAGTYGPLNKGINALKDGETRLFSLYDKNGHAVNNVEFITPKIAGDKLYGNKANTITQMNGNGVRTGNVVPENYAEQMMDLVNALNPKDIPVTIKQLFQYKGLTPNPLPTQRATGGMMERQPTNNRRYL